MKNIFNERKCTEYNRKFSFMRAPLNMEYCVKYLESINENFKRQ